MDFFILVTDTAPLLVFLGFVPLMLSRLEKKHAFLYLIALGVTILATDIIKIAINAPRPDSGLIDIPLSPSFPSSHAALGFVPAGYMWLRTNAAGRIALVAYGILVAYSRVFLGVHFMIDVVIGSLIGFTLPYTISSRAGKIAKFASRYLHR